MGLGRRGIEALWREDPELQVDVPENIVRVIVEADPHRLLRLWHSVLAAVPHQQLKQAHELLDQVDERMDMEIEDEVKGEKDPAVRAQISRELRQNLPRADDADLCKAHELYLKALATQSDNEEAWRGIARIKAYRKEFDDAPAILDQIIQRDPNSGLSYYNRAAFRMRRDEPQTKEVLEDLCKAIELDYSLRKLATKDADFNDIGDNPEFVQLTT